MRVLAKIAVFLFVFGLVLAWKLPYDAFVAKSIRRAEEMTGAAVTYTPVSASPLGVKVADLRIRLASGAHLKFDSAHVFPTREGLVGTAYQGENEMEVSLNLETLHLELDDIRADTGSKMVGQATVKGQLDYLLGPRSGTGEILIRAPELKLPLPVAPDEVLEVGTAFEFRRAATSDQSWTGLKARVNLTGTITGSGNITMQPRPGSPSVNGSVNFEVPTTGMKGTLRLSGSWDNMVTDVIPRT